MNDQAMLPLSFDELVDEAERMFRTIGSNAVLGGRLLFYTTEDKPGKVHLFHFNGEPMQALPHVVRALLHAYHANQAVLVFENTGFELKDVPEDEIRKATKGRASNMEEFARLLVARDFDQMDLIPLLMKRKPVQKVSLLGESVAGRRAFLIYKPEQTPEGRTFVPEEDYGEPLDLFPLILDTKTGDPEMLEAMSRAGLWLSVSDEIDLSQYVDLNPLVRSTKAGDEPKPKWTPPGWDIEVGPDAPD